MSRATLVVTGDIVLRATAEGLDRAEAIGIDGGRVVSAGARREVLEAATPGARVIDAGSAAVIPGLTDSHIHLIALARSRRELRLDEIADAAGLRRVAELAAARLAPDAWLRGRGWHATAMTDPSDLAEALGDRPALLTAHDGHSAWASPAALRLAGIGPGTDDPPGGRIERDAHGAPTGVLRETALALVGRVVPDLSLEETAGALDEQIVELHRRGLTGVTDAGDGSADGGSGRYAALGSSFSAIAALNDRIDGRLRVRANLPHAAIGAAARLGLRTGMLMDGMRTISIGWAKLYSDGALGSRTAALFAPYADDPLGGSGLLRLDREAIGSAATEAVPAGISLAIHAIGDRAAATVLDALEGAPPRLEGAPPHRIEHLQLLRAADRGRIAAAGITASMQPIHAVADRDLADVAWAGRLTDAYAWRSIAATGARLVFGSDAPIESADPWLGIVAAVERHLPSDGREPWTAGERLAFPAALAAYTSGAGAAAGRADEGHLRPGAHADLAILDVDLATLLAGGDPLAGVKAALTMVDGVEVHRS